MSTTAHLYGPSKVGGDTLSFCGKCRMDLAHVIVSMVDGRPSKVECKTCRSTHRFRSGGPATPSRSRTRVSAPKTVIRAAELWQQKLDERPKATILPYQTTQSFSTGELVQHPIFGVGIVEAVRSTSKIAVLFREGEKLLVHGLGA